MQDSSNSNSVSLNSDISLQPDQVTAQSQSSSLSMMSHAPASCEVCWGPVDVQAEYDDLWQTRITNRPVFIHDQNGEVLAQNLSNPITLSLQTQGVDDGTPAVPATIPQLGTFHYPQVARGSVTVGLVPDPSAADEVAALEAELEAMCRDFANGMLTALEPWIREWERSGWWGAVGSFFSGVMEGLQGWWEGEGDFWGSVWETLKSIPGHVADAALFVVEGAQELWDNRDKFFDLLRAFAEGAINTIESTFDFLKELPGEVGSIIKDLAENGTEWVEGLIEVGRQTRAFRVIFSTISTIFGSIPVNYWTETVGRVGGFIIPEIIIALIFAVIAWISAGTLSGLLAARLTAFVAKVSSKLAALGRAGTLLLDLFAFIQRIGSKIVDLVRAARRAIDEAVESATDVVTRIIRRSGWPSCPRGTVLRINGARPHGHDRGTHTFQGADSGGTYTVPRTTHGFPDFSNYIYRDPNGQIPGVVNIPLQATSTADMSLADAQAGISRRWRLENGYTWHHSENVGRMELVPTELNNDRRNVPHTGGRAIHQAGGWTCEPR